ncbi:MAG: hypothetical protein V4616_03425 [Bacteroidota bacterium]
MNKLLLFLVALSTCVTATAQRNLVGTWKYHDLPAGKNISAEDRELYGRMMANANWSFFGNKAYRFVTTEKTEEGNWKYNPNTQKITTTDTKGNVAVLKVTKIKGDLMNVTLNGGTRLVLKKSVVPAPDLTVTEIIPVTPISNYHRKEVIVIPAKPYTPERIAKKWYFTNRQLADQPVAQNPTLTTLMRGSFFNFSPQGTFEANIMSLNEGGNWVINPKNGIITLTGTNETESHWRVEKVTDTELVLVKGSGEEIWTFASRL